MKILNLLAIMLICGSTSAQVKLSVATDKPVYNSGDTIEVRVTITNNTDSVFSMHGSGTCIVKMGFNNVKFTVNCTMIDEEFQFPPASYKTWVWHLHPVVLGIPSGDGEQIVYGYGAGMMDSTTIVASRYYGGQVEVSIPATVSFEEIQSLRDSLNVSVLESDTLGILGVINQTWHINDHTIDSVVQAYSNDYRLNYIFAQRMLFFDEMIVSSVESDENATLEKFSLSHNYPNPFNPTTEIQFTLHEKQYTRLSVFDLSGRLISTLVDRDCGVGVHTVRFDASNLPSGVYIYRLLTPKHTFSRSMLVLK